MRQKLAYSDSIKNIPKISVNQFLSVTNQIQSKLIKSGSLFSVILSESDDLILVGNNNESSIKNSNDPIILKNRNFFKFFGFSFSIKNIVCGADHSTLLIQESEKKNNMKKNLSTKCQQ